MNTIVFVNDFKNLIVKPAISYYQSPPSSPVHDICKNQLLFIQGLLCIKVVLPFASSLVHSYFLFCTKEKKLSHLLEKY